MHRVAKYQILAEVAVERGRQDARWGEQNHPDGTGPAELWESPISRGLVGGWDDELTWADVAGEDAYSVATSADHLAFARDGAAADARTWADVAGEEFWEVMAEADPAKLRAELIQLAAVAVCWVEAIDRREQEAYLIEEL